MTSTAPAPARPRRAPAETLAPSRVVVEHVQPEIDCGRFPVKRTVGERMVVTVDAHADGHDLVAGVLLHRRQSVQEWTETPLTPLANDEWEAGFVVDSLEPYVYTVEAWIDEFRTWRRGLKKKLDASKAEPVDLLVGAQLL